MKKRLQFLAAVLVFAAATPTMAQTVVCFTDAFGFNYFIDVNRTSPKYWEISGSIELDGPGFPAWPISGYGDMANNDFFMLWGPNPSPDGCITVVDNLEFYASSGSAALSEMDWVYQQTCDGFGVVGGPFDYPVTYSSDGCPPAPGRVAADAGNMADIGFDPTVEAAIKDMLMQGGQKMSEILSVEFLRANPMADGMVFTTNKTINPGAELMIYNHVGQLVGSVYANNDNMIVWDGMSASGSVAESGMYVAVLRDGASMLSTKFIK